MGEHRSGRSDDSGLIDLDALMREATASHVDLPASAPSSEPLPPRAACPPTLHSPRAEDSLEVVTAGPRGEETRAAAASRTRAVTRAGDRRSVVVALVAAAVLGLVAAARLRGAEPAASAPAERPGLAPQRLAPPPSAGGWGRPTEAAGGEVVAVDPASLPPADDGATAHRATTTRAGLDRARPVVTPKAGATAAATMVVLPPSPAAQGDLGHAMRGAVGPREEREATAEIAKTGSARQLRPSPGAVVGAIHAVLPQARACLGPDDAIRGGALVFRSDGSVARVELEGTKDVDQCVRSALSKARVEPFADDTFTTRVTVRP